jgi:hypothetical protein
MAVARAEPLEARQRISTLAEEPDADISDLIDTLANRFGESHFYRFAPVASDVPERSIERVAPLAPNTGDGAVNLSERRRKYDGASHCNMHTACVGKVLPNVGGFIAQRDSGAVKLWRGSRIDWR